MMAKTGLLFLLMVMKMVTSEVQTVSVKTKIGTINGFVEEASFLGNTANVQKFLGIPFAEPPVGNLRFKKPVPKSPLGGPLDAFRHRSACSQMDIGVLHSKNLKYEEDCLYLNIYVPEIKTDRKNPLPVMVWFYGGGFVVGFTDMYLGDNLATHGDVIVVTVSYRLSVWGFLSTGDEHAPGNYGLWDQHLAIKWVHDNIAAFGGDTDRVTVFGESAGSASVMYQALYPGNQGLFQRVIGQSGSVGAFWASNKNSIEEAKRIGFLAGCESEKSEDLVSCLREVPSDLLTDFVNNFTHGLVSLPLPFLPRFDNAFVTTDPKQTFKKSSGLPEDVSDFFSSLDILSGVTSAEGSIGLSPLLGVSNPEEFLPNRTYFKNTLVPKLVKTCLEEALFDVVTDAIVAEYTNWDNPEDPVNIRNEYVSMWGDAAFNTELYKTLEVHAKLSPRQKTYMYVFDVDPDFLVPFIQPIAWFTKMGHGEDLPFVFGFRNPKELEDEYQITANAWEERVSADFMTVFSNFAKTGNPNSPNDLGLDWLPYTSKHQHYLQIARDMTSSNVKQRWNTRRDSFWANLLPKIVNSARSEGTKYSEDLNRDTCGSDKNCSP